MKLKTGQHKTLALLCLSLVPLCAYSQNMEYWYNTPVMQALDGNSDKHIDSEEISNAKAALLTIDSNADGTVSETEMGGPGSFAGWVRLQTSIRIIDRNADMSLSPEELDNAATQLKRLDHDHDGKLVIDELLDNRIVAGGAFGAPDPDQQGQAMGMGAGGPSPEAMARMQEMRRMRQLPGGEYRGDAGRYPE